MNIDFATINFPNKKALKSYVKRYFQEYDKDKRDYLDYFNYILTRELNLIDDGLGKINFALIKETKEGCLKEQEICDSSIKRLTSLLETSDDINPALHEFEYYHIHWYLYRKLRKKFIDLVLTALDKQGKEKYDLE